MTLIWESPKKQTGKTKEDVFIYEFDSDEEGAEYKELSFREKLIELALHEEDVVERKAYKRRRRYEFITMDHFINYKFHIMRVAKHLIFN